MRHQRFEGVELARQSRGQTVRQQTEVLLLEMAGQLPSNVTIIPFTHSLI